MLILSVGYPNAGQVLGAFEAAQVQCSTRAFVFSTVEPHRMGRKASGHWQTKKATALTSDAFQGLWSTTSPAGNGVANGENRNLAERSWPPH
jgi:hypothetical protein